MVDPVSLSMALFAALLAVVGQMLLKIAMSKVGIIGLVTLTNPSELIWLLLIQPLLWIAAGVYAIGFLIWLVVLSRIPLSVAYPTLATTYIFIPMASALLLGETINSRQWVGMVFIVVGVILVSVLSANK